MAKTIRHTPERDQRTHYPTKRARKSTKRAERKATRQALRTEYQTC